MKRISMRRLQTWVVPVATVALLGVCAQQALGGAINSNAFNSAGVGGAGSIPPTLALTPQDATNPVGREHRVTAELRNSSGSPVRGASIVFSVSGANPRAETTQTTGADGRTTYAYTGTNAGNDTIRACLESGDLNGSCDPGEITAFARKTYMGVDATPPETTITDGPPASTNSTGASFSFVSSEPGSIFGCQLDGGGFGPCSSPRSFSGLSPGAHTFEVSAVDAAGNVDPTPASRSWTVTTGPPDPPGDGDGDGVPDSSDACPTVAADTPDGCPPPGPVLSLRVKVTVVSGKIFFRLPRRASGASAFIGGALGGPVVPGLKGRPFMPLSEARLIPVGSLLDTRKGTVEISSARDAAGNTQSGEFLGGVFQVLQSRKRSLKGLTELRLKGASFASCRRPARGKRRGARRATALAAGSRAIRRVGSRTNGRFRTRGRDSASTSRGTSWTTTDRCDGTLTKVTRGTVAVRDFRRKKTIVVRAGKSYLARAQR